MKKITQPHIAFSAIAAACIWVAFATFSATANEDAFITFRVIDNFVNGYGLRWNVYERVQVYTHPLWLFVNVPLYYFVGNAFQCGIIMGLICSFFAAYILLRNCPSLGTIALAAALLISSRSLTEYATSGLENALTNLLLVAFALVIYYREKLRYPTFWATLVVSLAMLNRLDLLFLFGIPFAVLLALRVFPFSLRQIMLGGLPLAAWMLFALFYYGFILPNTYYAKLDNNINHIRAMRGGWRYVKFYFTMDWAGALLLVYALALLIEQLILGLRRKAIHAVLLAIPLGIVGHIIYVIFIGGDYMAGRFLTAPAFAALTCLVLYRRHLDYRQSKVFLTLLAALWIGLLVFGPNHTRCWMDRKKCPIYMRGIEDNWRATHVAHRLFGKDYRMYDAARSGWTWKGKLFRKYPPRRVVIRGHIGQIGYYSGPKVKILDSYGLGDPLMARLTPHRGKRLVHHKRKFIPRGYLMAIRTGDTSAMHSDLRKYYETLRFITQGDLWDAARIFTILNFHTGFYDQYLESYNTSKGF